MRNGGMVLVWGPPRSGTTWLYNAVRAVLREADIPAVSWAAGQDLPAEHRPSALIVKSHQAHAMDFFREYGSVEAQAFVIFRDPVSAFQSLVRTQQASRDELIGWLRRDTDSFEQYLPELARVAVCREEWIRDRAVDMIDRFASLLDIPLSADQAAAVAGSLSKERVGDQVRELRSQHGWKDEFTQYDKDTQWHANHIAPTDHVPVDPTSDELERLVEIGSDIERLTEDYSLWTATAVAAKTTDTSGESLAEAFLANERKQRKSGLLSRLLGRR